MLRRSARSNAHRSPPTLSARFCTLALTASMSACAYGTGSSDVDRTPIANTGAGASIIYPGRAAPTYQTGGQYGPRGGVIGNGQPAGSAGGYPQAPAGSGEGGYRRSGSGSPAGANGGGGVTFLGGSEQDELSHKSYKNVPTVVKALTLPFALAAAPFKAAYDAARGEPESGPEVPRPMTQTSRLPAPTSSQPPNRDTGPPQQASHAPPVQYRAPAPHPPRDYESIQLNKMARELEQRQALQPYANRGAASSASPVLSIADELAALQRRAPAPRGSALRPPTPSGNPQYASLRAPAPSARRDVPTRTSPARVEPPESPFSKSALRSADGIVDRNNDGRIDHWLYRENGRLVREILDDDFDGQGERTILYDITSNQVKRIEEDFNRDSAVDSWTDYRDGRVIRRRGDVDCDGAVDSWTYYREGEISRHERDTTGDGFRDRVGHYRNGVLDFEEQDHDGDGRAEVTVRYDAKEQIIAREEDLNGDGSVDLISHFENGKLTSRELLDPKALEAAPRR